MTHGSHAEGACKETAPTGPSAWRLTADLLFIVEHPEIREAVLPSHESTLSIDAALPSDRDAVFAIAKRHEPPEMLSVFEHWWQHGRAFFDARTRRPIVLISQFAPAALAAFGIIGA